MGLAGIDDARAGAFHCVDVAPGQGRDPRHQLHEVERRALADQEPRELALDLGRARALRQYFAFGRAAM